MANLAVYERSVDKVESHCTYSQLQIECMLIEILTSLFTQLIGSTAEFDALRQVAPFDHELRDAFEVLDFKEDATSDPPWVEFQRSRQDANPSSSALDDCGLKAGSASEARGSAGTNHSRQHRHAGDDDENRGSRSSETTNEAARALHGAMTTKQFVLIRLASPWVSYQPFRASEL